jgi:hypothetical protein
MDSMNEDGFAEGASGLNSLPAGFQQFEEPQTPEDPMEQFRRELINMQHVIQQQQQAIEDANEKATQAEARLIAMQRMASNPHRYEAQPERTPPTNSQKASLPKPDPFEKDKSEYPVWRSKMQAKLRIDGPLLGDTEAARVDYVMAFLNGEAAKYAYSFRDREGGRTTTLQLFEYLDLRYADPHQAQRARHALQQLAQKERPFAEFIADFERLLSESGAERWDDDAKTQLLTSKISTELRQLSITVFAARGHSTETFQDRVRVLHHLDNEFRAAKNDGAYKYPLGGSQRSGTNQPQEKSRHTPKPPPPDPEAMDWSRTASASVQTRNDQRPLVPGKRPSHQEFLARRDRRLCYTCGNEGHPAHLCYYRPHPKEGNKVRTSQISTSIPPAVRWVVDEAGKETAETEKEQPQ